MSHLRRCGCVRRTRRPVTDMRGWGRRRQAGLGGWLRVEVQDLRWRWIAWGDDITSEHLVTNILQDFRLKIPNIKIPPESRSVRSNLKGMVSSPVLVLVCFPSPVLHFKLAQLGRKIHQSNGDYLMIMIMTNINRGSQDAWLCTKSYFWLPL